MKDHYYFFQITVISLHIQFDAVAATDQKRTIGSHRRRDY